MRLSAFIYAANLDCLRAMGAELVYFSPLADDALPPCDALWLPGGYPELHADTLAANTAMQSQHRQPCAGRQAGLGRVRRHDGAVRQLDQRRWRAASRCGACCPAA